MRFSLITGCLLLVAFTKSNAVKPVDHMSIPEIKKLFTENYACYKKNAPTYARQPKLSEINQKLTTYVKHGAHVQKESENMITKDVVIARNPELLGKDAKGKEIYNEWLIPKTEFLQKYDVQAMDLRESFKPFLKKAVLKAIDITAHVIKLLGGKDGKAKIKVSFGAGEMEVYQGGLLTDSYGISAADKQAYVKVAKC